MKCSELADFLGDYVADELPAVVRQEFERHLGLCPDCRRYLDSYRKTIQLSQAALRQTPDEPAAADVPEGLVAAILKAKQSSCK